MINKKAVLSSSAIIALLAVAAIFLFMDGGLTGAASTNNKGCVTQDRCEANQACPSNRPCLESGRCLQVCQDDTCQKQVAASCKSSGATGCELAACTANNMNLNCGTNIPIPQCIAGSCSGSFCNQGVECQQGKGCTRQDPTVCSCNA